MLLYSPQLWTHLGDDTVKACSAPLIDAPDPGSHLGALLHRYRPQDCVLDVQDAMNAYGQMCGWFQDVKPALVDMQTILMPNHHHSLAWYMAMRNCKEPLHGDWMEMAPALSSLPLHPHDEYAWGIVERLNNNARMDRSCAQLVQTLGQAHPDMAKAYQELWLAISAMYDEKERKRAAVELWASTHSTEMESLGLPSLTMD